MRNFLSCISLLALILLFGCEPTTKEWTFVVLLNGDNNLDSFAESDMKEMMKVGSSEQVNILVLRDYGPDQSSKIYYVKKGSKSVVKNFGRNIDSGDYQTLVDLFKFAQEKYPARRYFVDIWNHGSGWSKNRDLHKGISYDDSSGNHISTPQLALAMRTMKDLNQGQRIDILGMDACLMAMAEVVYEVSDSVSYVVASEETEPGDGWEYESLLQALVKNPEMSSADMAAIAVDSYIASYNSWNRVTQSAIDVVAFEQMLPLLNDFIDYGLSIFSLYRSSFMEARSEAQSFYYYSNKDLFHFVQLLMAKISEETFQTKGALLLEAIDRAVVKSGNIGMSNANGIAIWLPSYLGSDYLDYQELRWSDDSLWDEFLSAY